MGHVSQNKTTLAELWNEFQRSKLKKALWGQNPLQDEGIRILNHPQSPLLVVKCYKPSQNLKGLTFSKQTKDSKEMVGL